MHPSTRLHFMLRVENHENANLHRVNAGVQLHTLKFIGDGANALIIGKPSTGKSHVAKAVAYQATLQGFDVRYVEADTEFARYALASPPEQATLLRAWVEPGLLVLDDLFLAHLQHPSLPALAQPPAQAKQHPSGPAELSRARPNKI